MMRTVIAKTLLAVLVTALFATALPADEPEATEGSPGANEPTTNGPTKVTSIEGLTEYRLSNGYKVLLIPDSSKPRVTVNNTIFVGSRHEGYGEAGMAHLLEHMLFKGTPDHPDVPKVLQERGAQFNGTTWLDRTNYYETLPASDDNLEFAIRLEADRMINSFVKAEDLASEMTVVRNEFERGENSPSSVLRQKMVSAAFQWHNYGKATIGNRADIERVPIENLREFYKRFYQPDNAMLIIAGKFDPDTALQLAEKYFGSIPVPDRQLPKTYTEEPPQDGERIVTLRRVGEVPLVGAVYHIPAGGHPDFAAIDVLESILTMAPTGRLYKALVEKKLASSVSGGAYSLHDPGLLVFNIEVNREVSSRLVLEEMIDVFGEIKTDGVTEEEVERAKTKLLKQIEQIQADSRTMALQMSEWSAMGDWRLFFLYRDRLEAVTAEDVKKVAGDYLRESNRTVGFFIPTEKAQRTPVPPTPDLAEMIGDYRGREVLAEGEAFETTPENIQNRTEFLTLDNGMQVALLPKKTRGEVVTLQAKLRFGSVESLTDQTLVYDFLGPMMTRGTKELTREQIQEQADKLRMKLSVSSDAGTVTVNVSTKRAFLPEALNLLHQVLREPTFPEAELDLLKQKQKTTLQQQLNDPIALARVWLSQQSSPYPAGDPRHVESVEENLAALEKVTRERVLDLYTSAVGAEHAQIAVVGDFAPVEVLPQLKKTFGDWTADADYQRIEREAQNISRGQQKEILTPDKENAIYFAIDTFAVNEADEDYPALAIANFVLGGGTLSSRLGNRVRQKEGLSYGVGSALTASTMDDRTTWTLYAIANPTNVPKLKAVIQEEVQQFVSEGITAEELEAAKTGFLQKRELARSSDENLRGLLTRSMQADREITFQSDLEKAVEELTLDEVNSTIAKYFEFDNLAIVTAGDFAKATAEGATP